MPNYLQIESKLISPFSPNLLLSMGPLSKLICIKSSTFVKKVGEISPVSPFSPNPPLSKGHLKQLICIKSSTFVKKVGEIWPVSPFSPNLPVLPNPPLSHVNQHPPRNHQLKPCPYTPTSGIRQSNDVTCQSQEPYIYKNSRPIFLFSSKQTSRQHLSPDFRRFHIEEFRHQHQTRSVTNKT